MWVTVLAPASGTGTGKVRYTVAQNFSSAERTALITVGSAVHRVVQKKATEIQLKGKVSSLAGTCPSLRFIVANQSVGTNGDTDFRHGDCSDLRTGKEVDVRGFRQADGTVLARRVEIK
jgi:hypothetical protein